MPPLPPISLPIPPPKPDASVAAAAAAPVTAAAAAATSPPPPAASAAGAAAGGAAAAATGGSSCCRFPSMSVSAASEALLRLLRVLLRTWSLPTRGLGGDWPFMAPLPVCLCGVSGRQEWVSDVVLRMEISVKQVPRA